MSSAGSPAFSFGVLWSAPANLVKSLMMQVPSVSGYLLFCKEGDRPDRVDDMLAA
jgi:hypothetical protein